MSQRAAGSGRISRDTVSKMEARSFFRDDEGGGGDDDRLGETAVFPVSSAGQRQRPPSLSSSS